MLALVEARIEKVPAITRLRRRIAGDKRIIVAQENVLGMRAAVFTIFLTPRQAEKARKYDALLEMMSRGGVNKVVFKDGFPAEAAVTDKGFPMADTLELWERKAAEIAYSGAKNRRGALLITGRFGRKQAETAEKLSGLFRYVAVASDESCAGFCRRLCEKTGISVIERPGREAVLGSGAAVFFPGGGRVRLADGCLAVCGGKAPDNAEGDVSYACGASFSFSGSTPEGYPKEAIISEALLEGAISDSDITVTAVKRAKTHGDQLSP